ncbi:MAG: hypothetical protein PQJ49_10505 [Sphaerochaetaceae bacterium]|nr:hypothetical protein [Sphaerochaetaceae bacterium]
MPERDYQTMTDVMNQTNDGKLIHIGQEFCKELTFGEECPYTEASDLSRDVGVFETAYNYGELTSLTDLDSPVKAKKAGYYKREDLMGMLEAWCKVNKKTFDANPNGAKLRTRMVDRMLRNMGWDWEFLCLNASIANDPRGFTGLLPRMANLTDLDRVGVKDPTVSYSLPCLDAGMSTTGADGALSSLVMVFFDEDEGVSQIYPRGTGQKGIKHESFGFQWQSSADGNIVQASDNAIISGGLAVKNSKAAIRIANINPKDLEGMENLTYAMHDAIRYFKKSDRKRVKIYTTGRVISSFGKYYGKRVSPARYADAIPKNTTGDISYDIFTLRECSSMLETEGIIV